jgi:acyl-CoA synthetase (AMP-forming)/AMP-acid ligase II/lauroyl/myristoyl acyltransferase/acyl carrier protein
MGNLWSAFGALEARLAAHEAILAPGRDPLTFAGLRERIATIRTDLNRLGLGHGDPIAIASRSGADPLVCCLGVMACAVAAPIDPAAPAGELRSYFSRIRPKALIIAAGSASPARDAARAQGVRIIELSGNASARAGMFTLVGDPAPGADTRWNAGDDVSLLLLTSGTTSRPKIVPQKQRHLLAYTRNVNTLFGYGPADRTLHLMPLFHGAGLKSSLLVPLMNGASIVCVDGFETSSFFAHLDRYRPTVITAGYAFHKAILEGVDAHRRIVERSRLRFLRSGTGRLDPAVRCGLEAAFGAPVLEQYSMSETGAIACTPMLAPQGKPGSVGRPIGNEVAIRGDDGRFLGADEDGEIVVRGPSVFDGYLDDPDANAAAFVDGWFRTGDLGRLDADGFLTLSGRVKDVINRGGQKISPHEVETCIARHDAVAEVKVFGLPHESLGEEVAAAVVLRDGAPVTEAALNAFVRTHLVDVKVPRRIFVRHALPSLPSGKPDVRRLVNECVAQLDTERTEAKQSAPRALHATEAAVLALWRKSLKVEYVGPDDNFFLLGGDSLQAAELLDSLERASGVRLPARALYDCASTVSAMAAEIERRRAVADGDAANARVQASVPAGIGPASTPPSRPMFGAADLGIALTLIGLAPVAWLPPSKAWPAACRVLARAHLGLRGMRASNLEAALAMLDVPLTAPELERKLLADVYADVLMTLREHLPLVRSPAIHLHGVENLRAARARGAGAVLWTCPSASGGLIAKRALAAAGFPLVNLRSAVHPYSGTRFGMKVLNPIRTRIEDRYREHTVLVEDDAPIAFEALRAHLDANAIVTIAANGAEGTPFAMPFLGGTLKLSLGAPMLAALSNAPLLPLFTVSGEDGAFEVIVGTPVEARAGDDPGERARSLAQAYAASLETHVKRHPTQWRGWLMRHTWSPGIG